MAGKYSKAVDLIHIIKREKGNTLKPEELKNYIIKYIGADEKRTLRPYLLLMMDLALIKVEGDNVTILI